MKSKTSKLSLQQLESKLALKARNSDQHNITQERSANSVPTTTTNVHHSSQHDSKFNVFIYGINECDKGTPRNERSGRDFSGVIEIITKVNENISPFIYQGPT